MVNYIRPGVICKSLLLLAYKVGLFASMEPNLPIGRNSRVSCFKQ